MEPQDQDESIRVRAIETPVTGVLLGTAPVLLPQPADPILGWTTSDGDEAW